MLRHEINQISYQCVCLCVVWYELDRMGAFMIWYDALWYALRQCVIISVTFVIMLYRIKICYDTIWKWYDMIQQYDEMQGWYQHDTLVWRYMISVSCDMIYAMIWYTDSLPSIAVNLEMFDNNHWFPWEIPPHVWNSMWVANCHPLGFFIIQVARANRWNIS